MTSLKPQKQPILAAAAPKMMAPEMQSLLEALPDAILVMDAGGDIQFANQSAEVFFGRGQKALLQDNADRLFGDGGTSTEALQRLRVSGQPVILKDFALNGKNVSSLNASEFSKDLFLISLHYSGVAVKNEWVSRVKQALKPAQHMARVLAHEIKNPLSGIRGAAQLLASSDLSADDRDLAVLIDTETQRILRLVEKVNIFDDAAPQNHAAVNLHEVMAQVEKIAAAGFAAQVTIVKKYDPSLPDIIGQQDHLVQAVLNLVKNAAEAVPTKGGQIILRSRYDNNAVFHPLSHVRLPVCIEIEDNGPGIKPEMLERLFEPYQTTKPQGDGLGLSIVSKIVDDHGGAVDITSTAGKTVFRLGFPMPKRSAT